MPKPYQKPHPPIWVGAHSAASFQFAADNNYHVSQNLDVDSVIAEKFDMWRQMWRACEHGGPMPRTFLMRAVHVAETDEKARAEAEGPMMTGRSMTRDGLAKTRVGFQGHEDSPSNREIDRVFQGMSTSYDFWIDNGLALVGSPETVETKITRAVRIDRLRYILCQPPVWADAIGAVFELLEAFRGEGDTSFLLGGSWYTPKGYGLPTVMQLASRTSTRSCRVSGPYKEANRQTTLCL